MVLKKDLMDILKIIKVCFSAFDDFDNICVWFIKDDEKLIFYRFRGLIKIEI